MTVSGAEILREHFRSRHDLTLGPRTPSEILRVVRTSPPLDSEFAFEVRGRTRNGEESSALVTRVEIREALRRGRYDR